MSMRKRSCTFSETCFRASGLRPSGFDPLRWVLEIEAYDTVAAMTLTHIERELGDIKRTLNELAQRRIAAKEIRKLRQRIAAIEEHLGINRQIAA